MDFEWDDQKAAQNLQKHGIDFVDAARVFLDPFMIEMVDDTLDYGEERFIAIGTVDGRVLYVVYVFTELGVRLISARKATRAERTRYGTFKA